MAPFLPVKVVNLSKGFLSLAATIEVCPLSIVGCSFINVAFITDVVGADGSTAGIAVESPRFSTKKVNLKAFIRGLSSNLLGFLTFIL